MSERPSLTSPTQGHALRDWVQLHLVVLAWGCTGVLGKLIHLPATEVVAWRTGMAALGLAVVAWQMRASLRVAPATALKLLFTGMLVGTHWMLFFLSVHLANVSVCMAALPTTMLWCTLMEPIFERGRRISRLELGMGALMVAAVWLIFRVEFSHWQGFAAGLGAALVGAVFAVMNKHLVAREHYAVISCYQMAGACLSGVLALPFFVPEGEPMFHWPTGTDWLCLLALSQVCTVGAYAAYMDVLRRMSVFTVNVAYNLEPVYGIVLAALCFGDTEHMSGGFYAGTAIILGAVVALPWVQRFRHRRQSAYGDGMTGV